MGLMVWVLAGLLVAWLTFTFWPKSTSGAIANFGVATVGGLVGGILSTFLFPSLNPVYNITGESFFTSALVALVFLVSFRMITTRMRSNKAKPPALPEKEAV